MDNYYILDTDNISISQQHLYSNGYVLHIKDNKYVVKSILDINEEIELQAKLESVTHFVGYEYEFLLITDYRTMNVYNRHDDTIQDIGTIGEDIVHIANNSSYTAVMSSSAIMIFNNGFFDLLNEITHNIQNVECTVWSNDVLCIRSNTCLQFYDVNLQLLSTVDIACLCCRYIEKYHYWCAVAKDTVYFIEDNGKIYDQFDTKNTKYNTSNVQNACILCRSHKTALLDSNDAQCQKNTFDESLDTDILGNDREVLCHVIEDDLIAISTCGECYIYKRIDGDWQCKNISERHLFIDYVGGMLVSYGCNNMTLSFINKEQSHVGNLFFAINGRDVLVYDFDKKKTPCYDFKLQFERSVKYISTYSNGYSVHVDDTIMFFDINHNFVKEHSQVTDRVVLYNDKIINAATDIVLNTHVIADSIVIIYKDGRIQVDECMYTHKRLLSSYKIDIVKTDNIQKDTSFRGHMVYLLHDNTLYTSNGGKELEVLHESITSFAYTAQGLVYSKDKYMHTADTSIVVDTNFIILGTTDLEIYGYSRFGSIDTYYDKECIRRCITNLLQNCNYKQAIDLLMKFNLQVNLTGLKIDKLKDLPDKHIMFVVDSMITDSKLLTCIDYPEILHVSKYKDRRFYIDVDLIDNKKIGFYTSATRKLTNSSLNNDNGQCIYDDVLMAAMHKYVHANISKQSDATLETLIDNFKHNWKILCYVFLKCQRVDLCIVYGKHNIRKVIEFIKSFVNKDEIKKSAIIAYRHLQDVELVKGVYEVLNEDFSTLPDIYDRYDEILEAYKMYDDLVFYLIERKQYKTLTRVVSKYNLHDKLFIYISLNENNALIDLYSSGVSKLKNIELYTYLSRWKHVFRLYADLGMYEDFFTLKTKIVAKPNEFVDLTQEGIEQYTGCINAYQSILITKLEADKKYNDLGIIYETYLHDYNTSLRYYIRSNSIRAIHSLSTKHNCTIDMKDILNVTNNHLQSIDKLLQKCNKYKKKLENIQHDIEDDDFSVTSVCKTNRGIPGNLYEYEFYLEKMNEILSKLVTWFEESKLCLSINYDKDMDTVMRNIQSQLSGISEMYDVSYERSKHKVICHDFSSIINY